MDVYGKIGSRLFLVCFLMQFVIIEVAKPKTGLIEKIVELKDFKKFVRTHTNVLVIFAKSERDVVSWDVYTEVATTMKGLASIILVDCSIDKKLCKKLKSSPEPLELKHYKDGEFNKVYDRKIAVKSFINFLRDPTGEIPWEEDTSALDVIHLESRAALSKLLGKEKRPTLVMFYAPWCGYCKRLKPEYAAAATELKGEANMAGMDVDRPENMVVRTEFNISGFPTLIYFENGQIKYRYGGENTKDGLVKWMKSPSPPKEPEKEEEWSDTESDVVHLTDSTFDEFMSTHPSVLVMFYAPWCGHCKKLKPEYVTAAATMKEEEVNGILAAVDATKEKKLGERFAIKGYPTVKYFRDGVEAWDINVRTGDKVVEFMKDPKQPPPPPPEEVPWESVPSRVEHLNDESFKTFLKKKKHALVMFYAPWCGHCKKAKPEFMNAAEKFKEDNKVAFSAVDCTKNAKLCETHEVSGYPTFKYFNYGKNDQKYTGGREENDFVAFMSDPLNPLASVPSQSDPRKHWSDVPGFESVRLLTEANFDATIADNPSVLVMFYAPWCGHCQAMRPAFASAASVMKTKNIAGVLAAVDAVAEASLASRYAIKGFPTIKYFKSGKEAFDYELSRSAQDFINFMENPTPKYESWASEPNIPGSMRHLTHSNFDVFLAGKQRVLVMFYVPANPQCEELKPIYFAAAEQLVGVADAALTVVDCSADSDLCSKNNIGQYPSIKLYVRGSFVSDFVGSRSVDELLRFVKGSPSDKTEL